LLRDARTNLRGMPRTLIKDLEAVQKAAAGRRPTAAKRASAKRSTARKPSGASPRKPSGRTTRAARAT
jgi:hypothetical protein